VITFNYSDDASHAYVVHLWGEATELPVAADISFDSVEALLDYLAPEVPGYHVFFGGRGYLSARDGCKELTFWYELDPEPAAPAESAMPSAPAAAGAIGVGAAEPCQYNGQRNRRFLRGQRGFRIVPEGPLETVEELLHGFCWHAVPD
jgi:hypothetical protein